MAQATPQNNSQENLFPLFSLLSLLWLLWHIWIKFTLEFNSLDGLNTSSFCFGSWKRYFRLANVKRFQMLGTFQEIVKKNPENVKKLQLKPVPTSLFPEKGIQQHPQDQWLLPGGKWYVFRFFGLIHYFYDINPLALYKKNDFNSICFKQAPDNLADEYYSHGSWYKNPEESPFAGLNGPPPLIIHVVVVAVVLCFFI